MGQPLGLNRTYNQSDNAQTAGINGHLSKYCKQKSSCAKCAEIHQEEDCRPQSLKCKHCSLQHKVTDKRCPTYILQTKISNIMSQNNIPFHEARQIYQANTSLSAVLQKHQQQPTLPSNTTRPQVTSSVFFPSLSYEPPSKGNSQLDLDRKTSLANRQTSV